MNNHINLEKNPNLTDEQNVHMQNHTHIFVLAPLSNSKNALKLFGARRTISIMYNVGVLCPMFSSDFQQIGQWHIHRHVCSINECRQQINECSKRNFTLTCICIHIHSNETSQKYLLFLWHSIFFSLKNVLLVYLFDLFRLCFLLNQHCQEFTIRANVPRLFSDSHFFLNRKPS